MPRCEFVYTSSSIDSFGRVVSPSAYAEGCTITRCKTHNMPVDGPLCEPDLCPIGKIEEATKAALASIKAAKEGE